MRSPSRRMAGGAFSCGIGGAPWIRATGRVIRMRAPCRLRTKRENRDKTKPAPAHRGGLLFRGCRAAYRTITQPYMLATTKCEVVAQITR
jgi:hypothetical protein